jgi:hypothetical protein
MTTIQNQYQANREQARHNKVMENIALREVSDKEKQTGLKSKELDYKKPLYQAQVAGAYIDSIGALFGNVTKGLTSIFGNSKKSSQGNVIDSITITNKEKDGQTTTYSKTIRS